MTLPEVPVASPLETPIALPSPVPRHWFWSRVRMVVVLVIGATVLGIGLLGLLLPVLPGWMLIIAGLAILGTEFAWARWLLSQAKSKAGRIVESARRQVSKRP